MESNNTKLREALKLYDRIFQDRTLVCDCDIVNGARALSRAALASPQRNCEKYATLDSALVAWREQPPSVGPFDNWLFDCAKESEVAK